MASAAEPAETLVDEEDAPTLEIRILRSDRPDGSCRVLIDAGNDRRAEGWFSSPFTGAEVDAAISALDSGTLNTDAARAFGEELFAALIHDEVKDVYDASRSGAEPVATRLLIDDAGAAGLPWELFADPSEGVPYAALHRFVRGFTARPGTRPLKVTPPLRVLVASSSPANIERLPSELEVEDIRKALADVHAGPRINVSVLSHATRESLQNALREARKAKVRRPVHVLHWIGHGAISPTTNRPSLVFEREDGGPDFVDGPSLVGLLGSDVRLVFLNACRSAARPANAEETSSVALTTGVATALIGSGVPAVIGMQATVNDDRARKLATDFYKSLADGSSIDEAVLEARQLIRQGADGTAADIGIPILYLREGPGQLLDRPGGNFITRLFDRFGIFGQGARWAVGIATATIFSAALLAGLGLVGDFIRGPRDLLGNFNIVVSEFQSPAGGAATDTAKSLSNSLYRALSRELEGAEDLVVEMMSPAEAGRISGSTPDQRASNAAQLASETNADMVIYGVLHESGTSLQPEFYIAPRALTGAEELAGAFRLGSPVKTVAPPGSTAAGVDLQRNLQKRTAAVIDFVAGLTFFVTGDFKTAEDRFTGAIADKGWADADGKEVVYLFAGTSAALLGRLDAARSQYQEALDRNGDYGRAMIGLAEVQYHQSSHLCDPDKIDAAGVISSRDQFRRALSARDQPPISSVSAKGHFGIGRAHVCLSQAGVENGWADAERELNLVIADYEGGNMNAKDLAAEAHAQLATVRMPAVGSSDKDGHYRAAVEEYRKAIELSLHDARKALFYDAIGWVMERLGDDAEATRAYEQAVSLAPDDAARDFYTKHLDQVGVAATPAATAGN